jgi:group I intron endonuclease
MTKVVLSISGIYRILNKKTGKSYVGSSLNVKKRISKHKTELKVNKHHSKKLQRSWNLHGEEVFIFSLLEAADKEALLNREQFWIDKFKCSSNGYNVLPTAGSNSGYKLSKEHIQKISEANTGRVGTPEQIERMSAAHIGNKPTLETRKKMGISAKGHSRGLGYRHTPEALAKISDASKKRKFSRESIAKRVASRKANAPQK